MDLLVVGLRAFLASVFLTSALAKLAAGTDTEGTAEALGVPPVAARLAGRLLVPLELTVAVLLLGEPTGRSAAVGATLLLAAFLSIVVRTLLEGRRPSCNCFG